MAVLDTKYLAYETAFSNKLTETNSVYDKALRNIALQFEQYAIPIEERAKYIVQAELSALQTISTIANQATIAIIAEEKDQEVKDSNIALNTIQISLTTQNIAKMVSDIAVNNQQIAESIARVTRDNAKSVSDIAVNTAQITLLTEQKLTQVQATAKGTKDVLMVAETILTQAQETAKKTKEVLKIQRDTAGYSDQIYIEMVKQQANLSAFAVNSGSTTAQTAIDKLNTLMTSTLARAT